MRPTKANSYPVYRKSSVGGNIPCTKTQTSASVASQSKQKEASILPAICKSFGTTFLFGSFFNLIHDLLEFVSPFLLKLLIDFVSHEQNTVGDGSNATIIDGADQVHERDPLWRGIFYAILLFVVANLQLLFMEQYFQQIYTLRVRVHTALVGAIYKETLYLSNMARKESTVGEIVNLMAVGEWLWSSSSSYVLFLLTFILS